jgi:hypothetical protein
MIERSASSTGPSKCSSTRPIGEGRSRIGDRRPIDDRAIGIVDWALGMLIDPTDRRGAIADRRSKTHR